MEVMDVVYMFVRACDASPRKANYSGGKTSTSAVLGHSTFTISRRAPPAAPVSGSMISSGQIAPRMKLVRRASRDLSADVQARERLFSNIGTHQTHGTVNIYRPTSFVSLYESDISKTDSVKSVSDAHALSTPIYCEQIVDEIWNTK